MPYLGADPSGGLTRREDGDVLGPVQPVDGQLGGGGPLHHGDVVLPGRGAQQTVGVSGGRGET